MKNAAIFAGLARNPVVAGVVVLGVVYFLVRKRVANAASDVLDALNPTSSGNIVNRGVSEVGRVLTGEEAFSLGGWFYDLTHPEFDPNAPIIDNDTRVLLDLSEEPIS